MDTSIFLPYIDVEDGLNRLMKNKKLYARLVKTFLSTASGLMDEIDAAVASSDTSVALDRVHTLKGAAANLSYKRIQEDCIELELDLKGNGANAVSLHAALKADYEFSMDMSEMLVPQLEAE